MTSSISKSADRVMDSLDQWDEKYGYIYVDQRKHPRTPLRVQVKVTMIDSKGNKETIFAWCRNISRSGMSLIYSEPLNVQALRIGLEVKGVEVWFNGVVVRSRRVLDNFWEYGISFKDRIEA